VADTLDLNLFPFHRIKGQEWPQLPGLMALTPPKRTARGREDDRLIIYLTISGNLPFSSGEYNQLIARTAQHYYRATGSLTSAIRTTAEVINQSLVERNLRTTGKGQYIIGRLILGVLRGSQFVFAQCGPTHFFHLAKGETSQIHDAQISGRGLGISQTTPLYLSQRELHPGDQVLLCAELPAGWEQVLPGERAGSPDALRRKLTSLTDDDLNAVQIQVLAGKGNLTILKGTSTAQPTTETAPAPIPQQPVVTPSPAAIPPSLSVSSNPTNSTPASQTLIPARPTSQVESGRPASRFTRILSGETPSTDTPAVPPKTAGSTQSIATPAVVSRPLVQNIPPRRPISTSSVAPSQPKTAAKTGLFISPRTSGDIPEIKRNPTGNRQAFRWAAGIIRQIRAGSQKISQGLKSFLPNLLPAQKNGESEFTSSSLALIAIAIPVLVVIVGTMVYGRYGSVTGYQEKYKLAQEQAALARGQTDPTEVRRDWDTTLYYLDQADSYQQTQDSRNLRQEAQTALDNLDGILRLDFRPAIIGGLSRTIQVSRMAATSTDLYLLDSSKGSVIRAQLGSQGYEVDTNFQCGPGQYNGISVNKLLDIEALQMSNIYNARMIGLDASGTLLYCGFKMDPVAVQLVQPPLGWQSISTFSMDADGKNLYVLDPTGNAVWVYQGSNAQFPDLPIMFFGEQVPQNMNTAIDLAANTSDLYLLFSDGHITACPANRYDVVPMRCIDPATYVDTRPERQPGPKINDAIFNQITFASAPDPSVYMLEPLTQAVYRFSPRSDSLELRGQFRAGIDQSATLFSGPATAMIISPNRYMFLSTGNQVFFATDVP
jgi:hypothetical protein